jgi:hypothetical protein
MINIYEIYSNPLGCNVCMQYQDGILFSFKSENPTFDVELCKDKRYVMFFTEQAFLNAAKEHKVKVTIVKREVTFDMFWDRYNYKTSGKKEAQDVWKKLSKQDQIGAFDYIPIYEGILKITPVNKLYGSTYLNKKRWIK